MTGALLKKQMMEVFSFLYKDRKTGKHRSAQGIVLYAALYLFVFISLGIAFYSTAKALCAPLVAAGIGWAYWCIMGALGMFLGVFGSVFSSYSALYRAKDNDLLLSMPIPASRILLVRLLGVYAMGLMYSLIVMLPSALVWFTETDFSPVGTVCVILIPLMLSVLVLVLSALLGWLVALVAGKIKHKNIVIVAGSLLFIVGYYYFYGKAYDLLQLFLQNVEAVAAKLKAVFYLFYQMGRAAEGDLLSMLFFTLIVGGSFALTYLLLSRSFIGLATASRSAVKTKYRKDKQKSRSVGSALLQKELRRFLGSANYMLNCGLGIVFMPVAAVMLVWKAESVRGLLNILPLQEYGALLAVAGVCMIATMNDITAPSVSLEGKNLWLVQSLPVSGKQVLIAKLQLQLLLTVTPAIPLLVVVEWLVRPNLIFAVLMPIVVLLFILLMATLGLCVNLKMPNLHWTSEVVPIKQSLGVMIALFGGWVIVMASAGLCFVVSTVLPSEIALLIVALLLLVCSLVLLRWLFTKGEKIFNTL